MIKRLVFAFILAALFTPTMATEAAIASPSTLTISSVNAYESALELNDQLYIVTGTINYAVNPTAGTANDLFLIRLMNGAVELGNTAPYAYYDDGYDYYVASIYFNAAEVAALGLTFGAGSGYSMRIDGNPVLDWTSLPSVSVAAFDSWYEGVTVAATQLQLTNKVRTLAIAAEATWGITLTELIGGVRKLTAAGENYFTTVINDLRLMAPSLFSQAVIAPNFPSKGLVDIGYTGGADANQLIYGANWAAQTFTATSSFDMAGVYLNYLRLGSPGDITVSLRAVVAGLPNGADLATGTLSANAASTTGAWDAVMFTATYAVTKGTQYAIVARALTGDVNNNIGLRMDSTGVYTGGQVATSANSGVDWAAQAAKDILFIIYGDNANNLAWYQQWEGRLLGTPFDFTNLAGDLGMPRLMLNTLIWFAVAFGIAIAASMKANNYKIMMPVVALMVGIGAPIGFVYAAVGLGVPIIMLGIGVYMQFGSRG